MAFHVAAAPVLLLTATSTVAADMLPLVRGVYVEVGTACKGASNADTLSYWGGNNGINDQQDKCKIKAATKDGSTYSLQRTCTSARLGGSFDDSVKVFVIDRTSFVFHRRAAHGPQSRKFRYCGPKVQF